MTADYVIALTTLPADADAGEFGRTLVEERLAACVNVVGPIRSIYRWEGAVEDATEWLLVVKARASDLAVLEARVRALHSYAVPEVLALPVYGGGAAYLAWLDVATKRDG